MLVGLNFVDGLAFFIKQERNWIYNFQNQLLGLYFFRLIRGNQNDILRKLYIISNLQFHLTFLLLPREYKGLLRISMETGSQNIIILLK